jgi:hypothetical protein
VVGTLIAARTSGSAVLDFVTFSAAAVVVVLGVYLLARSRSARRRSEPADLVAGLTAEVRKWQAEADHWRRTALRLQRELDERRP